MSQHIMLRFPNVCSSISIPASVTEIGFGAFNGAKFTNVLNLPNVKKVGALAFGNSKFAAVVLTNAELEIVSGKADTSGNECDNSVFSGNKAVFYTSVPSVMDKLYGNDRTNNVGIIACTNGGSFASEQCLMDLRLLYRRKTATFLLVGSVIQASPKRRD